MSDHWLDQMMQGEGEPPRHIRSLKLDGALTLLRWEEGLVNCRWRLLEEHCTPLGFAFGGYLGCVVDAVSVFVMATLPGDDTIHLTQDLRLSYFRPMAPGAFAVEGRVINRTRASAHVEVTVAGAEDGKLRCKAALVEQLRPLSDFPALAPRDG